MSYYLNKLSTSFSRPSSPSPQIPQIINEPEDKLARESDVKVSNITQGLKSEYKGFTIFIISSLILIIYILWTLLTNYTLKNKLFIDYYPDKYWSISIPLYSLILMIFIYWILALYNLEILTLKLNDVRCLIDENSVFPNDVYRQEGQEQEEVKSIDFIHFAPSGVWDLPIGLVNEVLYSNDHGYDDYNNNDI